MNCTLKAFDVKFTEFDSKNILKLVLVWKNEKGEFKKIKRFPLFIEPNDKTLLFKIFCCKEDFEDGAGSLAVYWNNWLLKTLQELNYIGEELK